jgi:hypothetical protein
MMRRRKLLLTLAALTLVRCRGRFRGPGQAAETQRPGSVPGLRHARRQVPELARDRRLQGRPCAFLRRREGPFQVSRQRPQVRTRSQLADIAGIWVTEFYGLTRIDARQAFYVVGSDTLGPMGNEFVPLATRADAEDFLKDHKGRRIIGFAQATPELAARLDQGSFD